MLVVASKGAVKIELRSSGGRRFVTVSMVCGEASAVSACRREKEGGGGCYRRGIPRRVNNGCTSPWFLLLLYHYYPLPLDFYTHCAQRLLFQNPAYFEDAQPSNMAPITGLAVEIWSVDGVSATCIG